MTCVPDGWESVTEKISPPKDEPMTYRHALEDGTFETRSYKSGVSGWKRNSKETGWTCSTPIRVQHDLLTYSPS